MGALHALWGGSPILQVHGRARQSIMIFRHEIAERPCYLAVYRALPRSGASRRRTTRGSTRIANRSSKILAAATKDDFAWQRLAYLTDTFGNRLAGSQALTDAIEWAAAEMARDGIDVVRKDPVKVPHWVRGAESLEVTSPHHLRLPVLGLGLSVGTPARGSRRRARRRQLPRRSSSARRKRAARSSSSTSRSRATARRSPIASTARRRRPRPARSRCSCGRSAWTASARCTPAC